MRVAFVLVELRRMGRQLVPLTQPGLVLTHVHTTMRAKMSKKTKTTVLCLLDCNKTVSLIEK